MVHTYRVTATALGGFVRDPGAVVIANAPGVDPALYMTSGLEDFVVEPGMHITGSGPDGADRQTQVLGDGAIGLAVGGAQDDLGTVCI
jgi:hypothetical protein